MGDADAAQEHGDLEGREPVAAERGVGVPEYGGYWVLVVSGSGVEEGAGGAGGRRYIPAV